MEIIINVQSIVWRKQASINIIVFFFQGANSQNVCNSRRDNNRVCLFGDNCKTILKILSNA